MLPQTLLRLQKGDTDAHAHAAGVNVEVRPAEKHLASVCGRCTAVVKLPTDPYTTSSKFTCCTAATGLKCMNGEAGLDRSTAATDQQQQQREAAHCGDILKR